MRVLVVSAHPVPDSYLAAVRAATISGLVAGGHEVDHLDLDADGFEPVLSREEWEGHRWTGLETNRPASAGVRCRPTSPPTPGACGPPMRSSSSTRRGGERSRRS